MDAESSTYATSDRAALESVAGAIQRGGRREQILQHTVNVLKAARPYYTWFGIYLLDEDTLVLGPFIGKPTEHTRIPIGSGICGLAARTRDTINIADVNADPRYLACSLETRSELVVPIMLGAAVFGEIDVDSDEHAAFTPADERFLEAAAELLAPALAVVPPA